MTNQKEYLTNLLSENQDAIVFGSLGTISYDLDTIEHPNKICIRGAMGGVLGASLGYAMDSDKQVICLIGDGAYLMCMGTMATIMTYNPKNLRVIIMNNKQHKSTGGQKTNFTVVTPFEVVDVE